MSPITIIETPLEDTDMIYNELPEMELISVYHDMFIPRHVYEKRVIPALNNSENKFKIQALDKQEVEILSFIYKRSVELRQRYRNGYRPEFTRPEISKVLGIKMPPQTKFRKMMEPLEGIVGRIERKDSFASGDLNGYTVYYSRPTWIAHRHC